jgi:hypothetical protein
MLAEDPGLALGIEWSVNGPVSSRVLLYRLSYREAHRFPR